MGVLDSSYAYLIFVTGATGGARVNFFARCKFVQIQITLRIARLRNALWRAILRRAILSMSFIRIARPIYFVFFVLICPSNSLMCCLEQSVTYLRTTLTKIDSVQKLVNIDFDKIQRLEALSFSLSLIKVEPLFIYAVNSFLIM